MGEVLSKILSMLAIIALGYFLKRLGIVKREDFNLLSRLLINVTIPASVIVNFNGFEMEPSMFIIPLLAIAGFLAECWISQLLSRRAGREERAFMLLSTSGFNTGAFTMAFVQALMPPACVVTVMVFDFGNCTTTAVFSLMFAKAILEGRSRLSLREIVIDLTHSFVFVLYVVMLTMSLLHLRIPSFIVAPAELIAPANVFLAMLSVGVGMEIQVQRSDLSLLLRSLLGRYIVAAVMAAACWFLLPFDRQIRLVMMLVSFSPATVFGAMHTATLGGNYALANTVISVSILVSLMVMTGMVLALG